MRFPRLFQFSGFETTDIKEFLKRKAVEIHLTRKFEELAHCARCNTELMNLNRAYSMKVEHLQVMCHRCFLFFISVDEVYARKTKLEEETRSDLFFTVISDLKTRKVIWVSQGRSKEALDEFFILLGKNACKKIKVVATDQFTGEDRPQGF